MRKGAFACAVLKVRLVIAESSGAENIFMCFEALNALVFRLCGFRMKFLDYVNEFCVWI